MNWKARLDRWSSIAARLIAIGGFVVGMISIATPAAREWLAGVVLGSETFREFTDDERQPGEAVELPVIGRAGTWGDWTAPEFCPAGSYVCGLRQRIEPWLDDGDDTAMNAVAFYCCTLSPDEPAP